MSLDSLLASLKYDVSHVAGVQANSGAAFGCNGTDAADVSGVSAPAPRLGTDTPDTACNFTAVSRKHAPMLACTAGTPDTAENDKGQGANNSTSWRWLLHFPDCEPLEVYFIPEATHDEVLAAYPGSAGGRGVA